MTTTQTKTLTPYASMARVLWDKGWRGIIPLPVRDKTPPPTGFTGHFGEDPTLPEIERWLASGFYYSGGHIAVGNIALRMPPGYIGLDVDEYDDKHGARTIADCETRWGTLPPTIRVTCRTDGVSGIGLFRVPPGLIFAGELPGGSVELIQRHHRFVTMPPSIHPKTGGTYALYGPDGAPLPTTDFPRPDELPALPEQWVQGLSTGTKKLTKRVKLGAGTTSSSSNAGLGGAADWLNALAGAHDTPCSLMAKSLAKGLVHPEGSRYDHMNKSVMRIVGDGECGHHGVNAALRDLVAGYVVGAVSDSAEVCTREFNRSLIGACEKVVADPSTRVDGDPCARITAAPSMNGHAGPATARHGPDPVTAKPVIYPAPSAPLANGRLMLTDTFTENGMVTTRRQHDAWLQWNQDHWAEIENDRLRREIYLRLEHARYQTANGTSAWNPTTRRVSDVMDALASLTHLSKDVQAPAWLDGYPAPEGVPANEVIACRNTLLHVTSRARLPLTPALFNKVSVPFDYDEHAPEPVAWLAFLNSLWPCDQESQNLLAEWIGYVLSGRTDLQKILLAVGPPRSGKGTIAKVLEALIGVGNYCGASLASLGTNFGLEDLIDKPLAIIADARSAGRASAETLERLLNISGEDSVSIDRKHRPRWNGVLPTRLMILSNELSKFSDPSGAIVGRFVTLTLTQTFLGREDHALQSRLLGELPGILLWALNGLDRLVRNNRQFTAPQSSEQTVRTMHDMISPMHAFLRDRCEFGPNRRVAVADLYVAWTQWCREQGRDHPGTVQNFGNQVVAAAPGLPISRPRIGINGTQVRCYEGLGLVEPDPTTVCVIHQCYWVAIAGTQFCARHPGGEPR